MFEPLPLRKDLEEAAELLAEKLDKATVQSQKKGRVYRNPHKVHTKTQGDALVDVWKWPEHNFTKADLPCYARGLFTLNKRIIVRGYDKFFNVDEVPSTKKTELEKLSGPFEVATKENGCIVFISGLSDGTLVVCSKHSTGEVMKEQIVGDKTSRHFLRAQATVYSQLEEAGKSPEDFARLLYENNVTAVCELCDDSFEEHIVEYPKDQAGLYLHGINTNTADFYTYPGEKVDALAEDWGFKKIQRETFADYTSLFEFLTTTAASGKYKGREIEGFVVRQFDRNNDNKPFFFKFKFEEPYSLFRQLRESAKDLINPDNKYSLVEIALKYPKHQRITQAWLQFAHGVFEKDEQRAQDFWNDKGIIQLRYDFMESLGVLNNEGIKLVSFDENDRISSQFDLLISNTDFRFVVTSVSFLGCGKTTTFKVLENLMPDVFGHVQSDNVRQKKTFPNKCMETLKDHRVVLADKNIHTGTDRISFPKDCRRVRNECLPPLTSTLFVAVNFVQRTGVDKAFDIAVERVKKRGANHQTVRYDETWKQQALNIMLDFKGRFKPMNTKDPQDENKPVLRSWQMHEPDDAFDLIINADISAEDSSLANAKLILSALRETYPSLKLGTPTEEEWQDAYQKALSYKIAPDQIIPMAPFNPKHRPEYYGVQIGDSEREQLMQMINENMANSETWKSIFLEHKVKQSLHVTIGHLQSPHEDQSKKGLWNDLGRKYEVHVVRKDALPGEKKPVEHFCDVHVSRIVVVDDVLVTLECDLPANYIQKDGEISLWKDKILVINDHLHITMGTAAESIPASESNFYLRKLYENGSDLADGEYRIGRSNTARVKNVDLSLPQQQVFIKFK